MIKFRTTLNRPSELSHCFDYVERYFKGTNLKVKRFVHNGVNSIVVTHGEKIPKVFLAGHLDVVDGEDHQFKPYEKSGRIYGRGALDMKSGIAVLMAIMKERAKMSASVGLMLTGDEEIGGFDGTKFLIDNGYSASAVILPDGGKAPNKIVQKEKGAMWLKLTAKGKAAHGSVPWLGDNAIVKLTEAVTAVLSCFTPHEDHPNDHWISTCNIGHIEGGSANNRVAEYASAVCDIRFTEKDEPKKIVEMIKGKIEKDIKIEQLLNEPLVYVNSEHAVVKAYQQAMRINGLKPQFALDYGSSDARFFTSLGIPVILSQPKGEGHHGKNEWVDIDSIEIYTNVVKTFLEIYCCP
ncbi:M20/M25/M40 family metallo-hydrolase [Candidatus Uhrbacteria bacterium]|nr:M20/M25/M40 family metallo-hydrolase [Candidatus Uhrbacteria bacterium]